MDLSKWLGGSPLEGSPFRFGPWSTSRIPPTRESAASIRKRLSDYCGEAARRTHQSNEDLRDQGWAIPEVRLTPQELHKRIHDRLVDLGFRGG